MAPDAPHYRGLPDHLLRAAMATRPTAIDPIHKYASVHHPSPSSRSRGSWPASGRRREGQSFAVVELFDFEDPLSDFFELLDESELELEEEELSDDDVLDESLLDESELELDDSELEEDDELFDEPDRLSFL